jgi:hypothetical protein
MTTMKVGYRISGVVPKPHKSDALRSLMDEIAEAESVFARQFAKTGYEVWHPAPITELSPIFLVGPREAL